jgi:hypothetical protein
MSLTISRLSLQIYVTQFAKQCMHPISVPNPPADTPYARVVGEITLGSTFSTLSAERGSMRNPFCASQRGASNE